MEWSAWKAFDADGVRGAPDEPGVFEVRMAVQPWTYEVGGSQVVLIGAGSDDARTVRRVLFDHLHGRGNVLLKSLSRTYRMEYRHAAVPDPSHALTDLLAAFRRSHGGVPVCNRV